MSSKNIECKCDGATIAVKPALTKLNAARNYACRKAEELIRAVPGTDKRKVEFKSKERKIQVDGADAFEQGRDEPGGTFVGEFAHLCLP